MKLERLELIGFKSFMNKTVLNFEDGIMAIVGPNGCGKSNIVDAIFWVMGDQSAKHLRGTEMADVIFAGSEKHPQAGMAEVNLTLSTEDGQVPADYSQFAEITITRRLYRSGESEYLINRTPCRLKDIVELFMDTGLGARSYSIIEQGHIDKIVGQKAQDRRTFIEDAAGITKFKSRKREAELKMKATDQNLLRVNDIIAEIKRQIQSLERQAKKAERYKEIKAQIRDIELTVTSHQFVDMRQKLTALDESLKKSKESHEEIQVEVRRVESLVEKLKLEITELDKQLQESQQAVYRTEQQVHETEKQKAIRATEIENWKSLKKKDQADIEQLEQKKIQVGESRKQNIAAMAKLEDEEKQIKEDLERKKAELASETQKYNHLLENMDSDNKALVQLITEKADVRNCVSQCEDKKRSLAQQIDRYEEDLEELSEEKLKGDRRKKAIEESISKVHEDRKNLLDQQKTAKKKQTEIETEIARFSEVYDKEQKELQAVEARLQSLIEIQNSYAGFEEGTKALLSDQKEQGYSIEGVLADVIQVEAGYEKAVEAVLGGRLQYVLFSNIANVWKALDHLSTVAQGRSHCFSLDLPFKSGGMGNAQSAEPLTNRVKTSAKYQPLIDQLLDGVVVVSTLKQGLDVWKQASAPLICVTKEGETISLDGGIYGGGAIKSTGRLTRKREIDELTKQVQHISKASDMTQKALAILQEKEDGFIQEVLSIQEAFHRQDVSETSFKKDVSQCEDDLERFEDEKQIIDGEVAEAREEKKNAEELYLKEKNKLEVVDGKEKALRTAIDTKQATADTIKVEIAIREEAYTQIQVSYGSIGEKREAYQRHIEHFNQSLSEIDEETREKQQSIALSDERQSAIDAEMKEDQDKIESLIQELEVNRKNLTVMKGNYDQQLQRVRVLEEGLKKQRSEIGQIETQLHNAELKQSELNMSLKHVCDQIQERYMLDLEIIADDYKDKTVSDEDKEKMIRLKEKAARMGEVNLMALEEFDDLKQRYETLEKQQKDLVESLDSLKKTIEKINRISRKRFEETFKKVNANFKRVFPVLFGGGKAELTLTDENDILETGIDIMAKPPGKKNQHISLLSGGEKALTAVSLIFSVFLMKPSPFCLLDEVDAPLDDANVGRFNDMVRQMTDKSQFIVITHNKKTMAASDLLYGVTMESPGVSAMVSVQLDKAIKMVTKKQPVATA